MSRMPLSVTIITLNEEANLARAIRSVSWADEILVVDSGSTDGTVDLARRLGAKVVVNPWPGYGKQKNFAQDAAAHDWILNLDADEELTPELAAEIQHTLEDAARGRSQANGFYCPRKTRYLGRWILHGGWYPNFLIRFANRKFARWTEPWVHEEWQVEGPTRKFSAPLLHYAFPSIHDQVATNLQFSKLGALDLKRKGQQASLLKLLLKPIGKFLETYVVKKGFLDGLPGFIISANAAHSMFLKYAYLIEARMNAETKYADFDHR